MHTPNVRCLASGSVASFFKSSATTAPKRLSTLSNLTTCHLFGAIRDATNLQRRRCAHGAPATREPETCLAGRRAELGKISKIPFGTAVQPPRRRREGPSAASVRALTAQWSGLFPDGSVVFTSAPDVIAARTVSTSPVVEAARSKQSAMTMRCRIETAEAARHSGSERDSRGKGSGGGGGSAAARRQLTLQQQWIRLQAQVHARLRVLAREQIPCVVRGTNMEHQLAGGHSSWCPELES